ncbi:MAG: hypothetical protein P5680_26720, partial [Limnospira sp. PMC 737.11]|uniref:hypothetical protein n=1 Tax=Limnospira sp. PMC 737.11 TaxID=2981095 RepID=UPI0028E0DC47
PGDIHTLAITADGTARFDAAVGADDALGELAVTAATIRIDGAVVTTDAGTGSGDGGQHYTGAVLLGADTTLTTGGTADENIVVTGTLNSADLEGRSLTLNTGTDGDIVFTGPGHIGNEAGGALG